MNQDYRLPQNSKEGLLYGIIICGITVFFMTSLNVYLQFQTVNTEFLFAVLTSLPLFFIVAMLVENFFIRHFSDKMVSKFAATGDSFNANILFSVLFTVLGMSFCMTFIGDFIGHGFTLESGIISRFFTAWPRNFAIVLFLELLIAQPLARKAMANLHK